MSSTAVMCPLLLGWFINYVPDWLSIALMFVGFFTTMAGYPATFSGFGKREMRTSGVVLIGFGVAVISLEILQRVPWLLVVSLLVFTRWIEGAAAIRFFQRANQYFRTDRSGGKSWTQRILYYLLLAFIVIMGGWMAIFIFLRGPIFNTLSFDLAVVLTFVTVVISILGLSWKFWSVRDRLPIPVVAGFILAATGAEINNLKLLKQALEVNLSAVGTGIVEIDPRLASVLAVNITIFLVGSVAYTFGYWTAVGVWFTHGRRNSKYVEKTEGSMPSAGRHLEDARDLSALELTNAVVDFFREGPPDADSWSQVDPSEYNSQVTASSWDVLDDPEAFPEDVVLEAYKVALNDLENISPPPPIMRRGIRFTAYELFSSGVSLDYLRRLGTPEWALTGFETIEELDGGDI